MSFIVCIVVILSSGYGSSCRAAIDEFIRPVLSGFVPRVGGLAIYISLLCLIPLLSFGFIPLAIVFDLNAQELTWLILSSVPIFAMGLAEDLGFNMSPGLRLAAQLSQARLQ